MDILVLSWDQEKSAPGADEENGEDIASEKVLFQESYTQYRIENYWEAAGAWKQNLTAVLERDYVEGWPQ